MKMTSSGIAVVVAVDHLAVAEDRVEEGDGEGVGQILGALDVHDAVAAPLRSLRMSSGPASAWRSSDQRGEQLDVPACIAEALMLTVDQFDSVERIAVAELPRPRDIGFHWRRHVVGSDDDDAGTVIEASCSSVIDLRFRAASISSAVGSGVAGSSGVAQRSTRSGSVVVVVLGRSEGGLRRLPGRAE